MVINQPDQQMVLVRQESNNEIIQRIEHHRQMLPTFKNQLSKLYGVINL
jgi:hypothetical protein